jgi:hypothetical protein
VRHLAGLQTQLWSSPLEFEFTDVRLVADNHYSEATAEYPAVRHLVPMSDVGRQSLPDHSQEWRDRLRWMKLAGDEQLVMSVHLIVRRTHEDHYWRVSGQIVQAVKRLSAVAR